MDTKKVYVIGSPHFPPIQSYDLMRSSGGMACLFLKKVLMRGITIPLTSLDVFLEQFYSDDPITPLLVDSFESFKRNRNPNFFKFCEQCCRITFDGELYNDFANIQEIQALANLLDGRIINFRFNEKSSLSEASIEERDAEITRNVIENSGQHNLVVIGGAHQLEGLRKSGMTHYRVDINRTVTGYDLRGSLPSRFRESVSVELEKGIEEMSKSPYVGHAPINIGIEYK